MCRLSRLGVTDIPKSPRTAAPTQATAAISMPVTTPRPARSTARAARTAPVSTSAFSGAHATFSWRPSRLQVCLS